MFNQSHHCWTSTSVCFVILSSCFISISSSSSACNQLDLNSLLSISLTFFSRPPLNPLNWSTSKSNATDCCLWEGIACNPDGRVTYLWLPSRGLTGTISPSLINLTHLSHLNLSHNTLSGPLPHGFFSSLTLLRVLDLSFNNLRGNLSNTLPSSIETLDLSSNHFDATIPTSFLQDAVNLVSLNVSNNSFTGAIPGSLCINSSLLMLLDFSSNDFIGEIPCGLGGCSELEVFRAGFNSLSGPIPSDIYQVRTLREISLASNSLSGQIGGSISNLTSLITLELYYNEFRGILPPDIGNLSKLEKLALHMNNFSGTIPTSLMNCIHLRELNLGFNSFQGNISTLNFSQLQQLTLLDLGNNNFFGQFPISLYSCKSLRAIRLARSNLEGQILPDMLTLQSLSFLSLSDNRLTNISGAVRILMGCKNLSVLILTKNFAGELMPDYDDEAADLSTDGFKNLRFLSLTGCLLVGRVPKWLGKLKKLEFLSLSLNQLRGSIPGWLGNLPSLFYLDLSNNLLTGVFPEELCKLPALTLDRVATKVDDTNLELPIFTASNYSATANNTHGRQYNKLSNFPRAIIFKNNSISGRIPADIGQMKFLVYLDLRHNNLFGKIPDQISSLRNLESLHLSFNHFSGEIPVSLTSLDFLAEFNISYNNLRGPIPAGTQLQSFGASAYEGNPELCGLPLPNPCQVPGVNEHKDTQHKEEEDGDGSPWFYLSTGLGYIVGLSVVCYTTLFNTRWRDAYFQCLTNAKNQLCVTLAVCVARIGRRTSRLAS
ncbi:receptor-like protein 2 [Malania oleifera]|uniref:receptor-like protein 2 n=1 Tax=Malania oleifera TaxID=397392 RepID=UPI0025ADF481|nr:receptor-like protein 2 [Malania oleifera]